MAIQAATMAKNESFMTIKSHKKVKKSPVTYITGPKTREGNKIMAIRRKNRSWQSTLPSSDLT